MNGEDLGIYVNVQPVKRGLLRGHFDDANGDLYEGTVSDFRDGWYQTFEPKNEFTDIELGPILGVVESVAGGSVDRSTLDGHFDVDSMVSHFALETMIGHWDGYFWYPNNYRVYHDPSTGLLSLLPWGVDQTFSYEGDLEGADGALAAWMLEVPSLRARYLREVWRASERMGALGLDEDAVEAFAMVLPWLEAGPYEEHTASTARAYLRDAVEYVQDRPAEIEDEILTW